LQIYLFPSGPIAGRKRFVTSPSQSRLGYATHVTSEFGVMYRLNHNHEIVELLEKLKGFRAEYPADLLVVRRVSFIRLVGRYISAFIQN
jgi:hypothetical protein